MNFAAALAAFASGKSLSVGFVADARRPSSRAPRVALSRVGKGAQYAGMGRTLYDACPYSTACSTNAPRCWHLASGRPFSKTDVAPTGDETINEARYAQPAIFALEVRLATLALVGH